MPLPPLVVMLSAALAFDALCGEVPTRAHPVVWMGKVAGTYKRWLFVGGRPGRDFCTGLGLALGLPALFAAGGWLAEALPGWWGALVGAYLLTAAFSLRLLGEATGVVARALHVDDVAGARAGLGALCSRDATHLQAPALAAAAIESVTENTTDSVVAPLFYFVCFGLPGALAYRAINTLDAMYGYHGRYEWFGKAMARLDDVANWIPARLTVLLFALAALWPGRGLGPRAVFRGLVIWRRDGRQTESPNAGRVMAMAAGILQVRLEKAETYILGAEHPAPSGSDVTRAIGFSQRSWAIAGFAAILCTGVGS